MKGVAEAWESNPQNSRTTMGVWGLTSAGNKTVGVEGDAYYLGSPPNVLNARIGVRGYAGRYSNETTLRVGVEGDATNDAPDPFVECCGVRGVNRGSISATGYAGVIGQALPDGSEGPAPDAASVGQVGVWGVTQSWVNDSGGVVGDATHASGRTYGVWGRTKSQMDNSAGVNGLASSDTGTTYGVLGESKSTAASAAGVRATGNGAAGAGQPRAAALRIDNGAITVSGTSKPAGTVQLQAWGMDIQTCWAEVTSHGAHKHTIGVSGDFTLTNSLIVSDSIILLTVEVKPQTGTWRVAY